MKSFFLLVFLLACLSCNENRKLDLTLNDLGVPLNMANYRHSQIQNVEYDLSFSIPKEKTEAIPSKLVLNLDIVNLSHPLYLDFKEETAALKKLIVNTKKTTIIHDKEHIVIPIKNLKLGKNTIEINFIAGELSLNRNENYLYTLLVPDRARTVFPCFDQPDIKAKYKLSISAPKNWEVLCGAPLENKEINGDIATYKFAQSNTMSTYLFSFVAGEFTTVSSNKTKREINMLFRETNEEKKEASIAPIFQLHQSSLDFLEAYTNYNFPFKKFDLATIPGFQYGGMEHTGAIQYRESTLFLDNSATQSQELSRAKLIAHETAHMWFGNLVTMKWFNDVWMKEVFANFMADKIVNPLFKDINHNLQFLTSHYPRAYRVDRSLGTNPIRQNLNNLNNAGSLYGGIIYNKAPIMMRQLELTLGESAFKKGIRTYIKTYANGNANWNDLVSILSKETNINLNDWSKVWVNSTGRPIFSSQRRYNSNNTINKFVITQKDEKGSDKIWPQSFEMTFVYKDHIEIIPVKSIQQNQEITQVKGKLKPLYIIFNSNGFGYGVFPNSKALITASHSLKNEVSRAQTYINAYEHTLKGNINLNLVFESLKKGMETETNELVLRLITNQITALYWKFIKPETRFKYQLDIENIIFTRLEKKNSKSIKKTLFNAYRSIAHSNIGVERLYRIWNKTHPINNLVLNQDDYTRLAQTLALFQHPNAATILEEAKSKLKNPDKLKRFEFLEPALNNDPTVRNTFFESFKESKNREKESWVQAACTFIHHPLRQEEGIKSLAMSLEVLEDIQKTGDIFFPLGWLNSTIGNYTSKEAYSIVENYLTNHPNLDVNLKRKLLQATDILYKKHFIE